MNRQDQKVSEGGLAIQATGSVAISTGMTPDQMTEIMVGLAKQLALYQAEAHRTVDERLERFRDEIISEFARPGRANPEAFKDPDFQYLLNRAQHAYARTGDRELGETLVQMVADRSRCSQRDRLSLTLNQAVDVASVLTVNEFAELGLCFMLTQTIDRRVGTIGAFATFFDENIVPLLPNISTEDSSYTYIVAEGCASINEFSGNVVADIIIRTYGGIFCKGFTHDELKSAANISEEDIKYSRLRDVLIPCLQDHSKLQLRAQNRQLAEEMLNALPLRPELVRNVCNLFENSFWQQSEFLENLGPKIKGLTELVDLCSKTPLCQMSLTPLGTAIGHAYMHRIDPDFGADLSIWIK